MDKDIKYKIRQNNYVGLLFFALVLASSLYIIKHETKTFEELDPTTKNIITNEKNPEIITEETDQIKKLREYLNLGEPNTFKIYQSMYIYNDIVDIDNINNENLLYMAYKYILKTTDMSNYLSYITCDQAVLIGLENDIIQCGGTKTNASDYTINSYITKDLLKSTIRKLYNININTFTNFYTSQDNLCYFIDNNYLCVSKTKNQIPTNTSTSTEFIKATKSDQKIEIVEKYKYIVDGIYYKGFNSSEIGEELYISTFLKINGNYYWSNTQRYIED